MKIDFLKETLNSIESECLKKNISFLYGEIEDNNPFAIVSSFESDWEKHLDLAKKIGVKILIIETFSNEFDYNEELLFECKQDSETNLNDEFEAAIINTQKRLTGLMNTILWKKHLNVL